MSVSKSSDDAHLLIGRALGATYRRENATEEYVSIPPAFMITDSDGAVWTLGHEYNTDFEFNVLRNDVHTGEYASRMERIRGVVRIFGKGGWRSFSRNRRHFI